MPNTLSKVLIFAVGAGVGSVATWKLLEARYQKIAQEEIDSVREYYMDKYETHEVEEDVETDEEPDVVTTNTEADIREYAALLKGKNYVDYSNNGIRETKTEEVEKMNKPYVISPDEFDENGYETITLFYTADGVVIDTDNKIIKDVEDVIGPDALDSFGEYEDDSVFVRDDENQIDYEILLEPREYEVIINRNAHPMED